MYALSQADRLAVLSLCAALTGCTSVTPSPYDIKASVGPLAAAEAGIDKGADALMAQLR
jgi:hypothetical protein